MEGFKIDKISRINVDKDDVIIFQYKRKLSREEYHNVHRSAKKTFKDNEIIVLDNSVQINFVKKSEIDLNSQKHSL